MSPVVHSDHDADRRRVGSMPDSLRPAACRARRRSRDGLAWARAMLATSRKVLIAKATTGATAFRLVGELRDVRLCDVRIGRGAAWTFAFRYDAASGHKVVLLTVYDDEHYVLQRAGRCFVTSSSASTEQSWSGTCVGSARRDRHRPCAGRRVALSAARLSAGDFWSGQHLGLTQRESEYWSCWFRGTRSKARRRAT